MMLYRRRAPVACSAEPPCRWRTPTTTPATPVRNPAMVPATSHGTSQSGGSVCAQPNQDMAKKPKMAAVMPASRRVRGAVDGCSTGPTLPGRIMVAGRFAQLVHCGGREEAALDELADHGSGHRRERGL